MQKRINITNTVAIFEQSQKFFLQDNPGKRFLSATVFEKMVYDYMSSQALGLDEFAKNLGEHITENFNVIFVR